MKDDVKGHMSPRLKSQKQTVEISDRTLRTLEDYSEIKDEIDGVDMALYIMDTPVEAIIEQCTDKQLLGAIIAAYRTDRECNMRVARELYPRSLSTD